MRTLLLAAILVASLALAATPAQATDVADAHVEGACYAEGDGAGTGVSVGLDADGHLPPHSVAYPDTGAAQDALAACATNGGPGPGSHLSTGASAADGAASADGSSVPATDFATGQDDDTRSAAIASGACYAGDEGASDSAGATLEIGGPQPPHAVNYPDAGAAQDALAACATNGGPGPGSHLTAGASAADGTVAAGVSTVPVTNALP